MGTHKMQTFIEEKESQIFGCTANAGVMLPGPMGPIRANVTNKDFNNLIWQHQKGRPNNEMNNKKQVIQKQPMSNAIGTAAKAWKIEFLDWGEIKVTNGVVELDFDEKKDQQRADLIMCGMA